MNAKKLLFSQTSKDTLVSLVGSGVVALAGVVFTILLARVLEPESFGVFSSLSAIVGIMASLGDLGIGSALINFIPKTNNRQTLVATSFWFQTIIAAFFALFISLAFFMNNKIVPGSFPVQLILAGILTGVYVLNQYAISLLKAEKKFFQAALVQSIDSIGKLSLVFLLFYASKLNISLALTANIISVIVSTVYGLKYEFNRLPLIMPKLYLKRIFKFAKWIGLARVFGVAVSRIDIILLNLMHSSFAAGIFAAAGRIGLVFALVVSALGSVVAPRFSGFTTKKQTLTYLKKLTILTVGLSLLMLVFVFFSKPIILLIFGLKYSASIPVFKWLTIALIPFLLSIVTVTPIIYTYNQPKFFAAITIIQVITMIILDILLIPKMGAMAPAVSIGVSNMIILILSGFRLKKLLA